MLQHPHGDTQTSLAIRSSAPARRTRESSRQIFRTDEAPVVVARLRPGVREQHEGPPTEASGQRMSSGRASPARMRILAGRRFDRPRRFATPLTNGSAADHADVGAAAAWRPDARRRQSRSSTHRPRCGRMEQQAGSDSAPCPAARSPAEAAVSSRSVSSRSLRPRRRPRLSSGRRGGRRWQGRRATLRQRRTRRFADQIGPLPARTRRRCPACGRNGHRPQVRA